MHKLIIEALNLVISRNGSIKSSKVTIKTEKELLALNQKELMKVYNKVMKNESREKFDDLFSSLGGGITDDFFRNYMVDKLFDIYNKFDVVYCPDIEDELYLGDDIFEENDQRVMILYNHNLFDHKLS